HQVWSAKERGQATLPNHEMTSARVINLQACGTCTINQIIMPATERLYYKDSHLIEFEARVVEISERVSGWTAVTLDRTAFYPTGGGQPSDTGTLNGLRVVECIDDEDNG